MNTGIFLGRPPGTVAVVGLGKSGVAVARLLLRDGHSVYASDAGSGAGTRAGAEQLGAIFDQLPAEGAAQTFRLDVGSHDLGRIRESALVVASPGVPPGAPPLAAAREAGVPIVSEIEVALHYLPELRYVAVTGTNGKTTTTALVGHLLRALGHDAVDAGNIGTPFSDIALADRRPSWAALELSSFQLHDTPSVRPTVGVLTNLSPDHLDRYASVEEYYADKARLFANAGAGSLWVSNADDEGVRRMVARVAGRHLRFSLSDHAADAYYDARSEELVVMRQLLVRRDELHLLGAHNVANALAAALAVMAADPAHATPAARNAIANGLRTFRALHHRLELVGEHGGVQWINDSKATNVSSTLVALEGMTRPYVLLLGGRHKGEPYTRLAEPFARFGKVVLAYGEAADTIEKDLAGRVPLERLGSSFDEVMRRAHELAAPGEAVLLSPACSSYDMFANYEERGAEFRRLAAQASGAPAGAGRETGS
jgi:UDP-N-acetylmuramoylalanine--D-glutamate ligase